MGNTISNQAETNVERLARSYFNAVNTDAWDELTLILHADAEFLGVGIEPLVGAEQICGAIRGMMGAFSSHHDEVTRVIACGTVAAVEVDFTGSTRDGRPVRFRACDVIDVENGQIRRITNWMDLDDIRRQLASDD